MGLAITDFSHVELAIGLLVVVISSMAVHFRVFSVLGHLASSVDVLDVVILVDFSNSKYQLVNKLGSITKTCPSLVIKITVAPHQWYLGQLRGQVQVPTWSAMGVDNVGTTGVTAHVDRAHVEDSREAEVAVQAGSGIEGNNGLTP